MFVSSCRVANSGELIEPAGKFIFSGVVIPSCVISFLSGSAFLAEVNTSAETILLPQGATIASVCNKETESVLALSTFSTDQHFSKSPAPASAFDTSSELPPGQPNISVPSKFFLMFLKDMCCGTSHLYRGICIIRRRPYRVFPSERRVIQENVYDMSSGISFVLH